MAVLRTDAEVGVSPRDTKRTATVRSRGRNCIQETTPTLKLCTGHPASMMSRKLGGLLGLLLLGTAHAGSHSMCVPEFGKETRVVVLAKSGDGLATPRDLQFHPATGELWVAGADEGGVHSGNFIIRNPGTAAQSSFLLRDRISFHYQDNMAQFSFDKEGKVLFSCQESENRYLGLAAGPNWFQGPTAFELYPCNGGYGRLNADGSCDVMTVTHDGEECTGDDCFIIHSDMLHEAPNCMGMAHDPLATTGTSGFNQIESRIAGNTVWYHDGMRNKLMRFDFDSLHGTEVIDHRFANIRRYVDVDIKRRAGVPGHMIVDDEARHLYIADTGNKRVLRVDADSGNFLRGAQCVPDECYPDNMNYTCMDNNQMFSSSAKCEMSGCEVCSRDLSNKYQCYAGYCSGDVCAGDDEFGCYTIYTETGDMFEYELWGCTDYEVFTTELMSPSGIALDKSGRVFVSDYDSGMIVAFDKTGKKLASYSVGMGVTGLEIKCDGADCTLYFVNSVTKEVAMLQVDEDCDAADASLPAAPTIARLETGYEARTCGVEPNRQRPNFILRHGEGYNNRMIVHHAYGKKCAGVDMGTAPANTTEEQQAMCEDRTDCSAMNYDLLVMAGFFCHPCLNNPCDNGGVCTNVVRAGFTCDCSGTGFSGDRCEISATTCPALEQPAAGAIVPPSCSTTTQQPGQACTLLCPSENMVAYNPSAPTAADLVSTCGADGAWSGGGMLCACVPGFFGEGCQEALTPLTTASGSVSAGGGAVKLAAGDGVEVPEGAVAAAVEITVTEYEYEVDDVVTGGVTWTARSRVKEFLPHGMKFLEPVTLLLSHSGAEDTSNLGAFYYDDARAAWVEQAGAAEYDGNKIAVQSDHFSLWLVMERPPATTEPAPVDTDDDGLSVGAWVGIGVGAVAGVVLLGVLGYYLMVPNQAPQVATKDVGQPSTVPVEGVPSVLQAEKPLAPGEHSA